MAKDPEPSPKQLQEGERVVAYFRRRRLENTLTLLFGLGLAVLLLGRYQMWEFNVRSALFAALIILGTPITIWMSTHYWLTDRRVLRGCFGVYASFPLEGAAPRVVKAPLASTVLFETPEGRVVAQVKAVDNPNKILRAHSDATRPAEPAAPAPADVTPDAAG